MASATEGDGNKRFIGISKLLFPLIAENVEKWELENAVSVNGEFPALAAGTSATSTHQLVGWLINQITLVYRGAEGDPNE
jgi:hypothetical protein